MPDYKETTVQGKSWQRCNQITFRNPYGQQPSASFEEEVVTLLGDRVVVERPQSASGPAMGGIYTTFEPESTFPLINPETGEPTGAVMSQADIYVALFSLYRQKSEQRDTAEANHRAAMEAMKAASAAAAPAPAPAPTPAAE